MAMFQLGEPEGLTDQQRKILHDDMEDMIRSSHNIPLIEEITFQRKTLNAPILPFR